MDERLRILKRMSFFDPDAKERYIAELERTIVGASEPIRGIGDTLLEIQALAKKFEGIIQEQGTLYENVYSDNNCYFLHERTEENYNGNRMAYGVAIARGTREIAAAIAIYYGIHGFETWSVDPIVFLDYDSNLFTWEVVL